MHQAQMPRQPESVGIIGCGTIGTAVARELDKREMNLVLTALADQDRDKARELAGSLNSGPSEMSIRGLCDEVEVVVEAADQSVVPLLTGNVVPAGKTLVVMSVGGMRHVLEEGETGPEGLRRMNQLSGRLIIPSGAIGGLDCIAAMAEAGLESVTLTTRKPPAGLDMDNDQPEPVFEGTAREAVRKLPKNVNVAASLSLAGLGFDATTVRVVSDPAVERNTHEVEVVGESGRAEFSFQNLPSPDNPKTSWNAALSCIAALRRYAATAVVGG